jgi:hypothetical protein
MAARDGTHVCQHETHSQTLFSLLAAAADILKALNFKENGTKAQNLTISTLLAAAIGILKL